MSWEEEYALEMRRDNVTLRVGRNGATYPSNQTDAHAEWMQPGDWRQPRQLSIGHANADDYSRDRETCCHIMVSLLVAYSMSVWRRHSLLISCRRQDQVSIRNRLLETLNSKQID
jgi:hypothetical protein